MKLDDFLKCKKVRAIRNYGQSLTEGKEYMISSVDYISVSDNDGDTACLDSDLFEPVLADNSEVNIQDVGTDILDTNADIKDTPKFKVGDKVYFGTEPNVKNISEVGNDNDVQFVGELGWASGDCCCHATQENYERLQATFPDINFEAPPKELKGSDLARAMLDKGWKYVPCYVSNYGESKAQKPCIVRKFSSSGQFVSDFEFYNHAVPFDPKTGEHLTQAVLDE